MVVKGQRWDRNGEKKDGWKCLRKFLDGCVIIIMMM